MAGELKPSQRAREAAIDQLSGIASPSAGVLRVEQAEALTLLIETARVSTNKDETIAKLREAVETARAQFAHYADLHACKGTTDGDAKAATNLDLANRMARALLTSTEKEG